MTRFGINNGPFRLSNKVALFTSLPHEIVKQAKSPSYLLPKHPFIALSKQSDQKNSHKKTGP